MPPEHGWNGPRRGADRTESKGVPFPGRRLPRSAQWGRCGSQSGPTLGTAIHSRNLGFRPYHHLLFPVDAARIRRIPVAPHGDNAEHYISGVQHSRMPADEKVALAICAQAHATLAVASALEKVAEAITTLSGNRTS